MPIRPSKDTHTVTVDMDRKVLEILDNLCAKFGRRRKEIIQAAIVEYSELPLRPLPELLENIVLERQKRRSAEKKATDN